jgi:VCBS repeat-containing protein
MGTRSRVNAVGVANPVSFTTAAGGSLTLYANGSYTYTPPAAGTVPNAGVSETINYTIEDADGDPSSTTLVIAVSNTNQMPVAVADTDAASEGGVAISGNVITGEGTDGNPAGADTLGDTPTTVTFANQNGNAITVNAGCCEPGVVYDGGGRQPDAVCEWQLHVHAACGGDGAERGCERDDQLHH